ncbi:unnamed protein product, partial [marine sediment metagenome]
EFSNLNDAETEKVLNFSLSNYGLNASDSKMLIDTYKQAREGKSSTEIKEIMNAIMTDYIFRIPTINLLEAQSKHQSNTYNYVFTWPSPAYNGDLGSSHALEIPFVFNTINNPAFKEFIGESEGLNAISQNIMDAWIAFAHTGNPSHNGIPNWPSYDIEKRSTMLMDHKFQVVEKFQDKERAAWDNII